jgi:hypothetical protein
MSSARRRGSGLEASRGMLPLLALQVLIEYGRAGASRPPVTAALLAANSLIYLRPGALDGVLPSLSRVSFNPQLIVEVTFFFSFNKCQPIIMKLLFFFLRCEIYPAKLYPNSFLSSIKDTQTVLARHHPYPLIAHDLSATRIALYSILSPKIE